MKRILLAATAAIALVTSAGMATAADGKFVFRWKGTTLTQNGGAGGADSGGESDHGGDGSGDTGGDIETGGGDGSGGTGDGGDDGGDGDDSTGARMSLSIRPFDDGALRDHYAAAMPFAIPTFLAAPSGNYRAGDVLTVCWDTEIYDLDGIAAHGLAIGWRLELPPSPLVRAITAGGQRVERDMDSFDSVFIEGSGTSGCADLELVVPEADSFGWGMGIPLGVKAVADIYAAWWAHDPVAWTEPGAYDTTEYGGPGWLYLDGQRIE